ncbi:SLC2A4 regulator-like [Dendronephthya gigantea]|uniref:SLC2A4 regulator-like n=1 Tax=Dendronephthya gigantea TaxID=151771 RepID=UPI001068F0CC|nr:SLC2A4 regulator-like [Dendronephthya gigantea]
MPAFREKDSQMSILNRLSRAGIRSGCFENRSRCISTGERVWSVLSERLNDQKDGNGVCNGLENGNGVYMQLAQDVTANFGRRHLRGNGVNEVHYSSHNVEHCSQDGARDGVPQHDILQNTKNYDALPQLRNGNASSNSWKRTAPLVIDIPNDAYLQGQNSEDAEEQMAAAVLTSLSLSPVLRNIQIEQDEIFEDVMNTDSVSDEATSTAPHSDSENKVRKSKLRRRKSSLKTLFQCTWPRCKKILTNSAAIVRHVRARHLGAKREEDDGFSDGEEEFYFIEVERNENERNDNSSEECTAPPVTRTNSRRCRSFSDPSMPTQPPVSSSGHLHLDDNFIWPLRTTGGRPKTKRPLHQTVHTNNRKARGDGKKCRKVFGMENKQLWCTQCRWKKACVKFID